MPTAEYRRRYYEINKEKILASNRRSREKNKHKWKKQTGHPYPWMCRCRECGLVGKHLRTITGPTKKISIHLCDECFEEVKLLEKQEYIDSIIENGQARFQDLSSSGLFRNYTPPDQSDYDCRIDVIEQAVPALLDERERIVIDGIYNKGFTLEKVGRKINVCKERARQIQQKVLTKLRKHIEKTIKE